MTEYDRFMEWARQKGLIEKRLREYATQRKMFKEEYAVARDTRNAEYLDKLIQRIDSYIDGATFVLNIFGYRVDIDDDGNARIS